MNRRKVLTGVTLALTADSLPAFSNPHKKLKFTIPQGITKLVVNSQDKHGNPAINYTLSVEPGQVFNITLG